jgi:methylmalonyl-CoA mutase N-terminal domain/subunit
MQSRIAESSYRAQQEIERGDAVVVGVNKFAESASGPEIDLQKIDKSIERDQIARVAAYRAERDAETVAARLAGIRRASESTENLMPHFLEAVDAGATLGEICDVLRTTFGRHVATEAIA